MPAEDDSPTLASSSTIDSLQNVTEIDEAVSCLATRVAALEAKLQAAIADENAFRKDVSDFTHSLDLYFRRHIDEDIRLSHLIDQDTQRSREAKEEYDNMATRFDADFRRRSRTGLRDVVTTVSLYVGIVLSLVFMAPVQAVWYVVQKLLVTVGLVKSRAFVSSATTTTTVSPGSQRRLDPQHVRRGANAAGGRACAGSTLTSATPSPDHCGRASRRAADDAAVADATAASQSRDGEAADSAPLGSDESATAERMGGRDRRTSSSSDEAFFDAHSESQPADERASDDDAPHDVDEHDLLEEPVDRLDDHGSFNGGAQRPGWALPSRRSGSFSDYNGFASTDFWDIDKDLNFESMREGDVDYAQDSDRLGR